MAKKKYTEITDATGAVAVVRDEETGACIPVDERNKEYQAYQKWRTSGNKPDIEKPEKQVEEKEPTKRELKAQLETIQARIEALED
jgi:tRNA U55 pseudouridine synthase TruB